MDGLISSYIQGGLKTGGGFNVGFYSMLSLQSYNWSPYVSAQNWLWENWWSFLLILRAFSIDCVDIVGRKLVLVTHSLDFKSRAQN